MKTRPWSKAVVALGVVGTLALAGCDDAATGPVISVTPDSVDLTGAKTVVLTAQGGEAGDTAAVPTNVLYMPLEWSVHNPQLGGIMSSAGHTAVYESNGRVGQNVVFVKDQSGREGVVAINQVR
jgi:hypothetical protein